MLVNNISCSTIESPKLGSSLGGSLKGFVPQFWKRSQNYLPVLMGVLFLISLSHPLGWIGFGIVAVVQAFKLYQIAKSHRLAIQAIHQETLSHLGNDQDNPHHSTAISCFGTTPLENLKVDFSACSSKLFQSIYIFASDVERYQSYAQWVKEQANRAIQQPLTEETVYDQFQRDLEATKARLLRNRRPISKP